MSKITIATSIVPRNLEQQRAALNSWLSLGIKVISLNSAEEVAIVSRNFPDVPIKTVNRTAEAATGKLYVFFDDVRSALLEEPSNICGIVNSDIILNADPNLVDFIVGATGDGLLFGSRIDINSMTDRDGEKFIYGFDYFFFSKDVLKIFPNSQFCLGAPWWDYWAPLVLILNGVTCKELVSPIAFHLRHETKWEASLFVDFGKILAEMLSKMEQCPLILPLSENTGSPERLTIFSLDVLALILKKTDKVFYPHSKEIMPLIEVGESQYLTMREMVICHHKRSIELSEQLKGADAATSLQDQLDGVYSSLSWRITKPLRWLADKVLGIVKHGK